VETTEWEDILVKKGIWEERADVIAQRVARAEVASRTEKNVDVEKEMMGMTDKQLDEQEDDLDEDVLENIRRMRIQELKKKAALEKFGDVYPIVKADFIREVSEASKESWVIVDMFKDGIQESTKCSELLRELARRHRACKFVKIRSTDCVEGWPDSSVPCLFLYHDGVMQKQLIGLDFCGGPSRSTTDSMEYALSKYGSVSTIFKSDPLTLSAEELELARELATERDEETENNSKGQTVQVSKLPSTGKMGTVLDNLDDDDDDDW